MTLLGQPTASAYLLSGLFKDQLSPSLLFVGKEGVGKKRAALTLAKNILCDTPNKSDGKTWPACDRCASCQKVDSLNHSDLLFIDRTVQASLLKEKPESQTALKIESVRHVDRFLFHKSMEGKKRTVIIDEASELTNEAANALLKTLEEPPPNTQIILLVIDLHHVPMTILSRCALVRFKPISSKEIASWLVKNQGTDAENALQAAERSEGSFSKALSLVSQEETGDLAQMDLQEFFSLVSAAGFRKEGKERAHQFLDYLINRTQKRLQRGETAAVPFLNELFQAKNQIERHVSPRLVLENIFLKFKAAEPATNPR